MSNYQTIKYIREAVQLIIGETPPDEIEIAGTMYQVYRDQSGYYIQVPTNRGSQRVTKDQWIVLQSAGDPGVPTIPEVKATGSFTVTDVIAAGDGVVGFTYNGVSYTDEPTAGDDANVTARTLSRKINRESSHTIVTTLVSVHLIHCSCYFYFIRWSFSYYKLNCFSDVPNCLIICHDFYFYVKLIFFYLLFSYSFYCKSSAIWCYK
jgi:hypothetical protein